MQKRPSLCHSSMHGYKIDLHELRRFTNNFSEKKKVGSGGYAEVYEAEYGGQQIAVKLLDTRIGIDDNQFMNELSNHMEVQHPNIVRLVGYCNEVTKIYIKGNDGKPVFGNHIYRVLCFEYMSGGSLYRHISCKDENSLRNKNWETHYKIIKGICDGLHYLHCQKDKPILHLDLKPANILLGEDMTPKIADFGLSRIYTASHSHVQVSSPAGTWKYMAPEFISRGEMSQKTDIFSLGVTILNVIMGSDNFDHYSYVGNTNFIENVKVDWMERDTTAHLYQVDTCTRIAVRCVHFDSENRPTITQIVAELNNTETKVSSQNVLHHRSFTHSRMQSIQAQALDMTSSTVADTMISTASTLPSGGSEWQMLPWLMRGLTCKIHRSTKKLGVGLICLALITLAMLFPSNSSDLHAQDSSSSSPTVAGKLLGSSSSGRRPLDVVIVYAFDCTDSTAAWYTVDDIFWLVQEKLTHLVDSRMGYIYVRLASNTYTSDMKLVDSADTQATGYKTFALRKATCTKNMASGLAEAHKMLTDRRYRNGTILLFSDGLIHKGDFFDGAESFVSEVPVHTFTLGGDAYNQGLHAIATNSPSGMFHTAPVPERPSLSASFLKLLDSILGVTTLDDEKPPTPSSGWEPLDVVIVYAFDCTHNTPAWYTMDDVFWLVQEKLTHFVDSCLGYIYFMLTGNTYTSDMKLVDSAETKETGYKTFARHRIACTENMAYGLAVAHKMINNRGYKNGIILLFSDGLIHKGDFFDGAESFISKVPVHTFTLGGNASNPSLQAIAKNSPGGTFNPIPVPERPRMSTSFSELLDILLRSRTA